MEGGCRQSPPRGGAFGAQSGFRSGLAVTAVRKRGGEGRVEQGKMVRPRGGDWDLYTKIEAKQHPRRLVSSDEVPMPSHTEVDNEVSVGLLSNCNPFHIG